MRAFWGLALLLPALAYLALVAYPPARAQSAAHEAVQSAVGTWEISNAEHDKTCSLIFKDDSIAGGFKLEFDQACADKLPRIAGVIAWSMGTHGTLRLLDNEGKAAFAFTEVETGMYEAEEPGAGIFFLQRAATARSAEQTAGQMTGTWLLARNGGETICTLALSAPAAGQDRSAIEIKSGCDASIARLGPFSWAMERNQLVLAAAQGETWRFEEIAPATWQTVPANVDSLLLMRQP